MNPLTLNIADFFPQAWRDIAQEWIVFGLCAASGALGVLVSFKVSGVGTYTGPQFWLAILITVLLLSVSYGAKFSDESARKRFTVPDFLQFAAQGVLWPAAVPGIATNFHIPNINPSPMPTVSPSP